MANQQHNNGRGGDQQRDNSGQGQQNNPGNFANDRERASEAGQKGGRN